MALKNIKRGRGAWGNSATGSENWGLVIPHL